MAMVRAAVSGRSFSDEAVEAIAEARRPSTLEVYEGKWRVFAAWCSEEALTPTELSPPQLANFILWLFNVKGYAISTIKGYRSMIATTYRHLGRPDPGKDNDLYDLIASLERRRPVVRSLVPRWNLPWVLKWLSSERSSPSPWRRLEKSHSSRVSGLRLPQRRGSVSYTPSPPERTAYRSDRMDLTIS